MNISPKRRNSDLKCSYVCLRTIGCILFVRASSLQEERDSSEHMCVKFAYNKWQKDINAVLDPMECFKCTAKRTWGSNEVIFVLLSFCIDFAQNRTSKSQKIWVLNHLESLCTDYHERAAAVHTLVDPHTQTNQAKYGRLCTATLASTKTVLAPSKFQYSSWTHQRKSKYFSQSKKSCPLSLMNS